jgi:apolipoprotein N-acyltransferase
VLGRVLDLLNAPMSDFSPGPPDQPPLPVDGLKVGVSICYEDAFGEEVIDALPAADLLVNVSNDAWFGDTVAPHQHQQKARMRAIEAGRDLVRATNTGISAVIDWRGAVTARIPAFQAGVLRGVVTPRRGATPYVMLGNAPVVLGAVLTLLAAAAVRTRRAGSAPPRSAGKAGSPPAP